MTTDILFSQRWGYEKLGVGVRAVERRCVGLIHRKGRREGKQRRREN